MRYRVMGEVALLPQDGAPKPLTRRRERSVLGVLLAARGTPVTAERLLADAWADVDAATLGSLQVAVSRLRSELEPDRSPRTPPSILVSGGGGYALRAAPDAVDAWRFESLAQQTLTTDDPGESIRLGEEAIGLWAGTPYPGCDGDLLHRERDRLTELHASVVERRAEDLLAMGRHSDALTLAMDGVGEHPFRERLWAALALAQHRGGRQAEALETLRRLRTQLAEELGVDPTPDVQDLEQRLLQQDPALGLAPAHVRRHRVEQLPGAHQVRPPTSSTVGRDDLLARAAGLLDELASGGRVRFLTVSGEPGIGKSRFLEDLHALAASRGLRMEVGRSPEGELLPPLWPWLSVVRALTAGETHPQLAPLLGDEEPAEDRGSGTTLRLYDAVADLLARSAVASGGLVVALEDLHRADVSSLQLLAHVASVSTAAPLLIVTTRRTTEPAVAEEPLVETLAVLARAGAERIRIEGLGPAAVGELLASVLGEDPDPQLVDRVAEATAGNPFYVSEYARLLSTSPDLRTVGLDQLPVPEGVRDVLRQRVARLPDASRSLLGQAAVLGQVVEPGLVASVTGADENDVLDVLDLAVATGLLVERGADYAFAHALTREALWDELTAARRMRLHARAVTALELAHPSPSGDVVARLAGHALAAAPLGEEWRSAARRWLPRAAATAASRQAHAEALGLWRAADRESDGFGAEQVAARQGQAQALLRLGSSAASRAIVQELVSDAVEREDWATVAASAAIATEAGVWTSREHGSKDEPFIESLTGALAHVDGADEARLCATLMVEHYLGFDRERTTEYGARATRAARSSGDELLFDQVLYLRILCRSGHRRPGDREDRLALLEELLGRDPGGETEVSALFHLGWNLFDLGRVEESDAAMARCATAAADLQHAGVDVPLAWWLAARARDGDDPRASTLAREALSLHESSGVVGLDEARCVSAVANLAPGDSLDAELVDLARTRGLPTRAVVAWGLVGSGQPERVRDLVDDLVPAYVEDYAALAGACLQLGVLAALDDRDRVQVLVDQLAPNAVDVVTYGALDHLGVVDQFLALGHRCLGHRAEALAHARRAVARLTELDLGPPLRRASDVLRRLESGA